MPICAVKSMFLSRSMFTYHLVMSQSDIIPLLLKTTLSVGFGKGRFLCYRFKSTYILCNIWSVHLKIIDVRCEQSLKYYSNITGAYVIVKTCPILNTGFAWKFLFFLKNRINSSFRLWIHKWVLMDLGSASDKQWKLSSVKWLEWLTAKQAIWVQSLVKFLIFLVIFFVQFV